MMLAWLHGAFIYIFIGVVAGFLSGLFGIGGGIIVVPALLYLFQDSSLFPTTLLMRFAVGTSLAIMLFTAYASLRSHQRLGDVLWSVFQKLWLGIFFGVILGSMVANFIPMYGLKIIFACFLLFIIWKMLSGMGLSGPKRFPATGLDTLISLVIGCFSGLLGIGGGTLVVPYLTYCGIDAHKITAVTALCSLLIAVVGTLVFIIMGYYESYQLLPRLATGYIYWPAVLWIAIPSLFFAPVGAKLMYVLPVKQLRYAFVVLLVITVVDLLI